MMRDVKRKPLPHHLDLWNLQTDSGLAIIISTRNKIVKANCSYCDVRFLKKLRVTNVIGFNLLPETMRPVTETSAQLPLSQLSFAQV